ncbi:hypothetical protein BUALT_Bualt01G0031200 [Buddleja alternifolia]|uniref:DUF3741 domain-containing protein n=1 Tax=Buddleja alternifolia TaxID=168488 RepID=A0AAV6YF05_9LAMI|nr:hypothetical protein BUALT_Bualt01G0031200 [Buddleja alternifolia]
MSTKPDFAQKLLHDLRVRKERMATTQNSSRQSSQTSSRDMHANPGRTNRGSRQINALESAGSRSGNTSRRSYGSGKSINTKESSNQIVLYESGQNSRQVRDLSMAIALAFENSGNLSKIGASSNPLVNFFNRFGRRSMNTQKTNFDNQSFSNYEFPAVSHIHITEISKGIQKLNQILKACSNGTNLDKNSIEVGKELLKGAINLEESLRMLANMNGNRQKSRIKLLEEDEDDHDNNDKIAHPWQPGRPRFSFDGPSRGNSKRQQLALSYLDETSEQPFSNSLVPYNSSGKAQNNSSSSQSSQEKRKISNVIAKLMGLEELPLKESTCMQNNSKGKVSRIHTKLSEPLGRDGRKGDPLVTEKKTIAASTTPLVRDSKKSRETMMNKPQNHVIAPNKVDGLQVDRERRQNLKMGGEKKTIETSDSKPLASKTKLQKKAENSKTVKADDRTHNRIGYNVSTLVQDHVLKKIEHSEDKGRAEQKGQNTMAKKHEGYQVESIIASKPMKSAPIDIQKKLSREKFTSGSGRVIKSTEKVPKKYLPNKDAPIIDTSHKTAVDQENFKKEGRNYDSSPIETQFETEKGSINPVLTGKKSTEVSATQKKAVSRKVQESENPRKIDVMMSRRNGKLNHLARSGKASDSMLKDLKQQMHNRNHSSKRMEQLSDSNVKEGEDSINLYNASEMSTEPMKWPEKLQNEDDQTTTLNTSFLDDRQMPILKTQTLDDNCDAIDSKFEKVSDDLQTVEQPYAFKDEQELKQSNQSTGHVESMELHNLGHHKYNQRPALGRQEQLTGPEKELKEIIIKSQLFLNTAEALFKLNIPVTFLHAGDHNDEVAEKKLVLDCAYEAMKRKARRNEVTFHPNTKTTISFTKVWSLDDLIKQLCKDLEMLKIYGGNGSDERDIANGLHKMLNNDLYDKDPDINCMWDFEWTKMESMFPEKEEVIKDVEKHMLNGLLDEITNELVLITVSV